MNLQFVLQLFAVVVLASIASGLLLTNPILRLFGGSLKVIVLLAIHLVIVACIVTLAYPFLK
jgi:hypothetical protein